jgi:hypothetical protein
MMLGTLMMLAVVVVVVVVLFCFPACHENKTKTAFGFQDKNCIWVSRQKLHLGLGF